jgi:hypothetical protein
MYDRLASRQAIQIGTFGFGPTTMGEFECAAVDGRSAQIAVVPDGCLMAHRRRSATFPGSMGDGSS